MSGEVNKEPLPDAIPAGQERLATQSERDDVNNQIASSKADSDGRDVRLRTLKIPLSPKPSQFTTFDGE